MLNVKKVEATKADPSKDQKFADGENMYLKVSKRGHKTFIFRYTYGSKRKELTLGAYPGVSLAEARGRRHEASKLLSAGRDPLREHQDQRTALNQALSVDELIEEYFTRVLSRSYKKSVDAKAMLTRDLGRLKGSYLVCDMKPRDIVDVINEILDRGSKVAANRSLALIRKMFDYAVQQHLIEKSPVLITRKGAGGREKDKERNLDLSELKVLFAALNRPTSRLQWQARSVLLLILLTGQRPGEVSGMRWEHINLAERTWSLPSSYVKNGKAHFVYLNDLAVNLLKDAFFITSGSNYVFESSKKSGAPIDRHSVSRAVKRLFTKKLLSMKELFTPHDLRRTFATRLADEGISPHVIEKILNHQMEGAMAIYNRAEYRKERKDAADVWGDCLHKLTSTGIST